MSSKAKSIARPTIISDPKQTRGDGMNDAAASARHDAAGRRMTRHDAVKWGRSHTAVRGCDVSVTLR